MYLYHVTITYRSGNVEIVRVQARDRNHAIAQVRGYGNINRISAVKIG